MSHPFAPSICPRLVVKIGSSLLVTDAGEVRCAWLATLVADVAAAARAGQKIIIVSSGAIALGARRLGLPQGGRASLEDAQAAAAVGQIALAQHWATLLHAEGLTAAQMLVTLDDLEDRRRYLNATATLDRLLSLGVVPVINENDSVATAEIRFGDNDRLAARVAQAAGADGVLILSDVDGLHTADPNSDPDAMLVRHVRRLEDVRDMAHGLSASGMGTGGMAAKLEAARIALSAGATLGVASGRVDHPLARFVETGHGTLFHPEGRAPARKAWLAGRLTVRGSIHVDDGAARALARGSSLLPAGAVRIEGRFDRGDAVDIIGPEGVAVARGLAEYGAAAAIDVLGLRSDRLVGRRTCLVHRSHLVLL